MTTLHPHPPVAADEVPGPPRVLPGTDLLAALLSGTPDDEQPVTHVHAVPVREPRTSPWPEWVRADLRDRLAERGVDRPWRHQVEAAELARAGSSVVVATGTASGKSLAYQLPALTRLAEDPRACVLYLAPTKALARDQLSAVMPLADPSVRPAAYDGDTPLEEREWVRRHTPLDRHEPGHDPPRDPALARRSGRARCAASPTWSSTSATPTAGVFGSHVGHVLRRLRRICRRYGAEPVFLLASATVADPAAAAARLIGVPVAAVTDDGSPRPGATFALWEPPLTERTGEHGAPLRRSAAADAAGLLADLVERGARTLAFVRSRRSAESVAEQTRRLLHERGRADLVRRVDSYRGGYLPEERRELERSLSTGALLGVATTNALELGIDIAGLDAVVLAGYPGTLASLWQQAGRAGRAQTESLVVFVARDDPLDHYLAHHPKAVFGRPVEATVTDPTNPYVLGPQLCCAAAELPLVPADLAAFGGPAAEARLAELVAEGLLRRRPAGWYWAGRGRPHVDIRGGDGEPVSIIEAGTGRLLGTVDGGAAHTDGPRRRPLRAPRGDVRGRRVRRGRRLRRRARGEPRVDHGRTRRHRPRHRAGRRRPATGCGHRPHRRGRRDQPGGGLPAPAARHRRGARRVPARPARAAAAHPGGVADARRPPPSNGQRSTTSSCRVRCTPPSTRPSASCRCWPPATAGTSAACPPRCTPTPGRRRSSSTTATRVVRASPSGGSRPCASGCRPPVRPSPAASARAAARPASSRRSAATATTHSTRPAPSACWTSSWTSSPPTADGCPTGAGAAGPARDRPTASRPPSGPSSTRTPTSTSTTARSSTAHRRSTPPFAVAIRSAAAQGRASPTTARPAAARAARSAAAAARCRATTAAPTRTAATPTTARTPASATVQTVADPRSPRTVIGRHPLPVLSRPPHRPRPPRREHPARAAPRRRTRSR